MKKLQLLIVILGFLSICEAQNINSGNYIKDYTYSKGNHNYNNQRGLKWQWDTVLTYDTLGLINRYSHSFDSNGKVEIQTTEEWQTNTWVISSKTKEKDTFDNNGYLLTALIQDWQYSKWVNSTRLTYTYDSIGNVLTEIFEIWQGGTWLNLVKHTYTYDSNRNKLTEIGENWKNKAWVNSYRNTNKYGINGKIITIIGDNWSVDDWYKSQIDTLIYNSSAQLIKDIMQIWYINTWRNYYQNSYTYDLNSNLLICLGESWKDSLWINAYRETYTYDNNGNSLTGIVENWRGNNWGKYLGNLNLYYANREVAYFYNGLYRYEAQFRSYNTSIYKNTYDNSITVYPIPAFDKIYVQIMNPKSNRDYNICLYNIQGKVILQKSNLYDNTELDISSFPKGVYMIHLLNQEYSIIKKIIKE